MILWFKVASPQGEGFRARRAIQVHSNPRTGRVIYRILNVVNIARHYLVMERYFSDTNLRDVRPLLAQYDTISMTSEGKCLFSRTIVGMILGGRYNHSMVGPSPATHSCTCITMLKVNNSTQHDFCTSMI